MTNDQEPTTNNQERPPSTNDRPPATNDQRPATKRFYVQLAEYSQLAFVLPACTVIGWIAGALLDRWLHTTWLYIAGLLLGIVAGFVELIRTVTKGEKG